MGKKRKDSSDSDEKKKKKKKDKDKKKKDKKKKDKKKKKAKKESSSSDSSSSSSDGADKAKDAGQETAPVKLRLSAVPDFEPPPVNLDALPPLEEGIQRFQFTEEEQGPLGVRFSGGSPPMILSVNQDSFASKKGIPVNFEVHAINGLALVQQNQQRVMQFMKSRPLVLDLRPLGWKPAEKMKELKRKQQQEEAEQKAKMAVEKKRREQVAKEAAEEAQRQAEERAVREEKEKIEREEMLQRAREAHKEQRQKEEEFRKALNSDPPELRKAADDIMEADYGADVKLPGRGLPLRLFTRRKEVAWIWAGEAQELIGGGAPDDTFTQ